MLDRPGQRPALREATLQREELERDQRERVVAAGLHGMQVAADNRRRDLALANGEVAADGVAVGAIARQAIQEDVVGRLALQIGAFEHHAQHFDQQGLTRAEEAADPDADALLVIALGGICISVKDTAEVLFPLRRDDQVAEFAQQDGWTAINDFDNGFNALLDCRGECLAYLHQALRVNDQGVAVGD